MFGLFPFGAGYYGEGPTTVVRTRLIRAILRSTGVAAIRRVVRLAPFPGSSIGSDSMANSQGTVQFPQSSRGTLPFEE